MNKIVRVVSLNPKTRRRRRFSNNAREMLRINFICGFKIRNVGILSGATDID